MPTTIDTTPRCKHCLASNKSTALYDFRAIPPMPIGTSGKYCYQCFITIEEYQQELLKEHAKKRAITLDFCIFLQNNFDYVMEQENSYIQYANVQTARSATSTTSIHSTQSEVTISSTNIPQSAEVVDAEFELEQIRVAKQIEGIRKKTLERDLGEWERSLETAKPQHLVRIPRTCPQCGEASCKCW